MSPTGAGEVLIFPYYTANAGNTTLFTLLNSTDQVKALKLRFREGINSRPVFQFNLYLGPFDSWAGAVIGESATPNASLITRDASCAVYESESSGVLLDGTLFYQFTDQAFTGALEDGGGTEIQRTNSGFFEVIEMGEVSTEAEDGSNRTPLGLFAVQLPNGLPANCRGIEGAWEEGGVWDLDSQTDMTEPTGGVYGTASIINVLSGYQYAYTAEALSGFYNPGEGLPASLHEAPMSDLPTLNSAATGDLGSHVQAQVLTDDGMITDLLFQRPVDAVSAVLMRPHIGADYEVDSRIAAETEWVITFPTRHFYVTDEIAQLPFTVPFRPNSNNGAGLAELASFNIQSREAIDGDAVFSDPNCPFQNLNCGGRRPNALSFATNVLSFAPQNVNGGTPILGANRFFAIDESALPANSGNINIVFDEPEQVIIIGPLISVIRGLPVMGIVLQRASNGTLSDGLGNNVLSNYGASFRQRAGLPTITDVN